MEKRREEISFTATDRVGATVGIGRDYAEHNVGDQARNAESSKFIL